MKHNTKKLIIIATLSCMIAQPAHAENWFTATLRKGYEAVASLVKEHPKTSCIFTAAVAAVLSYWWYTKKTNKPTYKNTENKTEKKKENLHISEKSKTKTPSKQEQQAAIERIANLSTTPALDLLRELNARKEVRCRETAAHVQSINNIPNSPHRNEPSEQLPSTPTTPNIPNRTLSLSVIHTPQTQLTEKQNLILSPMQETLCMKSKNKMHIDAPTTSGQLRERQKRGNVKLATSTPQKTYRKIQRRWRLAA